jgi:hypothetical protein
MWPNFQFFHCSPLCSVLDLRLLEVEDKVFLIQLKIEQGACLQERKLGAGVVTEDLGTQRF